MPINGKRRKSLGELLMPPTCCGRMACIRVGPHRVYGNVIDFPAGEPLTPRRIRIQTGEGNMQGQVVYTGEYQFLWWADEEED